MGAKWCEQRAKIDRTTSSTCEITLQHEVSLFLYHYDLMIIGGDGAPSYNFCEHIKNIAC